jgi:hypothetical protein
MFEKLLTKSNNNSLIYVHNFSKFDSIFLLKTLANKLPVKLHPIYRDGKIIKLKVAYGRRESPAKSGSLWKYKIEFFDSFLILGAGLDKLAKTFKVETPKGFFPLKVLDNSALPLDYKGDLPSIKYFFHPNPIDGKGYLAFLNKYKELLKMVGDEGEQ